MVGKELQFKIAKISLFCNWNSNFKVYSTYVKWWMMIYFFSPHCTCSQKIYNVFSHFLCPMSNFSIVLIPPKPLPITLSCVYNYDSKLQEFFFHHHLYDEHKNACTSMHHQQRKVFRKVANIIMDCRRLYSWVITFAIFYWCFKRRRRS